MMLIDIKLFNEKIFGNDNLIELANFSVLSGNVHSFIQCVDKGLNLKNTLKELIKISSELGYFRFTEFYLSIKDKLYIDYSKTNQRYKKIFTENWKIALLLINEVNDEMKLPLLQLFF